MLSIPASVRILLCTSPTDMRKSFDSLAALVTEHLDQDPLSGHLYVFVNRRRDRLKILYWEPGGYALWYRRLEMGTFQMAPKWLNGENEHGVEMTAADLAMLHEGIDLTKVKRRKRYQRPDVPKT